MRLVTTRRNHVTCTRSLTLLRIWPILAYVEIETSFCACCLTMSLSSFVMKMLNLGCSPFADSIIQKVKWHFNHMSSTQMESSLEKIQQELELQPPTALTLEDSDLANGVMNGHTRMPLEPGRWPSVLPCR